MFKKIDYFYDADGAGSGGSSAGDGDGKTTLTFDAWHEALPDEQKSLVESHTKGLKSALDSERGSRKDLEKQLRDMAKNAEKGSEAQAQLTKLADNLQSADRKADFYEAAHAAGVKNLKLAYTVAVNDEMFDKHGRISFDEMKKTYPELFGSAASTTRGDAGSGTQKKLKAGNGMNDFIRTAAGK